MDGQASKTIADGLADFTTDVRRSWERQCETTFSINAANLTIQTDGELEEGGCAGPALIMGLWGDGGHGCRCEPFLAHGTLVDPRHACLLLRPLL